MPTLPQRLAQALDSEHTSLSGRGLQAVVLNGCLVCLPHLSYAQWPPHLHINSSFPDSLIGLKSHWRGIAQSPISTYKVASWLDLKECKPFKWGLRKKIKQSQNNGFKLIQGKSELLAAFWNIYSRQMHRLGSVPLPKRFFNALLMGFDEGFVEIFLVYSGDKVVGGACNICVGGFYENAWLAADSEAQILGVGYLLHQAMINHAKSLGCEIYSFGRSTRASGVHRFKKQWNTFDVPLIWYKNGIPITGNPYPFKILGKVLYYMPFCFVSHLGAWTAKHIY